MLKHQARAQRQLVISRAPKTPATLRGCKSESFHTRMAQHRRNQIHIQSLLQRAHQGHSNHLQDMLTKAKASDHRLRQYQTPDPTEASDIKSSSVFQSDSVSRRGCTSLSPSRIGVGGGEMFPSISKKSSLKSVRPGDIPLLKSNSKIIPNNNRIEPSEPPLLLETFSTSSNNTEALLSVIEEDRKKARANRRFFKAAKARRLSKDLAMVSHDTSKVSASESEDVQVCYLTRKPSVLQQHKRKNSKSRGERLVRKRSSVLSLPSLEPRRGSVDSATIGALEELSRGGPPRTSKVRERGVLLKAEKILGRWRQLEERVGLWGGVGGGGE